MIPEYLPSTEEYRRREYTLETLFNNRTYLKVNPYALTNQDKLEVWEDTRTRFSLWREAIESYGEQAITENITLGAWVNSYYIPSCPHCAVDSRVSGVDCPTCMWKKIFGRCNTPDPHVPDTYSDAFGRLTSYEDDEHAMNMQAKEEHLKILDEILSGINEQILIYREAAYRGWYHHVFSQRSYRVKSPASLTIHDKIDMWKDTRRRFVRWKEILVESHLEYPLPDLAMLAMLGGFKGDIPDCPMCMVFQQKLPRCSPECLWRHVFGKCNSGMESATGEFEYEIYSRLVECLNANDRTRLRAFLDVVIDRIDKEIAVCEKLRDKEGEQ